MAKSFGLDTSLMERLMAGRPYLRTAGAPPAASGPFGWEIVDHGVRRAEPLRAKNNVVRRGCKGWGGLLPRDPRCMQ